MIVELRDYTMVPGTRDRFVELYEREFVESQIERGIDLIGTFRDSDRDDRFVWFRAFPNAAARAKSLDVFYTSDLWKRHREAANACIADSDNVLQLKPAWLGSGFSSPFGGRAGMLPASVARSSTEGAEAHSPLRLAREARSAPPPKGEEKRGLVVATVFHFAEPVAGAFIAAFRETHQEGKALVTLVTDPQPNSYPRLPIREGENVLVHVALFDDSRSARAATLAPELERQVMRVEMRRLQPTLRSRA